MKFVLAPDKFKGSLTGFQFCDAVEKGIRKVFPDANVVKKPLADGGDGTLKVVKDYINASSVTTTVHDPLFRMIEATYLFSEKKKIAFIEMSEASGHKLLKSDELNCMHTTSLGTGELIAHALGKGAIEIILGIGGSATNDAGMGMATALGYQFLDDEGNILKPIGKNLLQVKKISKDNLHQRLVDIKVKVACDVDNPFYRKKGAAHVYGPQKGASPKEIAVLDDGLKNLAHIIASDFELKVQDIPGSGAAGGIGGGAVAFLNASLQSGIDLIKEMADFETVIANADWIITGEGKLDNQTISGKTIAGVIESARKQNIPVAALCGVVELSIEEQRELGLTYSTSILRSFQSLEEAKKSSFDNLVIAAFNFANTLK